MKTLSDVKKGRSIFIVLFFLTLVAGLNDVYANPQRVAILPFQINAAEDMSFLRNGITDILESRLAWEEKVELISRKRIKAISQTYQGSLNIEQVRQIGTELGADYILFGSITILGTNVSLDAKIADVSGVQATHFFSHQSQGMDAVIPKIDQFVAEINAKIFGRNVPRTQAAATPRAPAKPEYDIHAHPEKLIQSGFGNLDQNTPNSGFIMMQDGPKTGLKFWKSRDVRDVINGLDLGDIDRDGKLETVIITHQQIHFYKHEDGRFHNSVSIARDKHKRYIGVDVADINGNGIDEIFVTALNSQRNSVSSFVLEFNGQIYDKLSQNDRFYYRVVEIPNRGKILLGQKSSGYPFKGDIVEMVWDGSTYTPGNRIGRVRNNNIIGLAYGDVMNDGQNRIAAYNRADRIQILKQTGKARWTGGDLYGGNMIYFAGEKTEAGEIVNPQYLPMRMRITDINRDGKYELITACNHDISLNLLQNFRRFTKTHIESLSWDGTGLASVWKTRRISGRVSDFAIGDFDQDGVKELVAAVVVKDGNILMTKARSTIIAYDLIQAK
ncbi:FG-GAP-like repeat-containing protein [Desulfococcaceae bacterium HSG9]|nr:FG-GAP-like repeat-containing protein [Desulfococcaceae bacterium HSG9]